MEINRVVSYKIADPSRGSNKVQLLIKKSLVFDYPCDSFSVCSPYNVTFAPGKYMFECWGAAGRGIKHGKGAYTSGVLSIASKKTLYIYIGATGLYNSALKTTGSGSPSGGGATDVRFDYHDHWYDMNSLISRIMVAAGGGGSEWYTSIGGDGGAPNGGQSFTSQVNSPTSSVFSTPCYGATSTKGGYCPSTYRIDGVDWVGLSGSFGIAGYSDTSKDMGGFGGGGYYGGASTDYSGGGSGGSSFISGHPFCTAVKNKIPVELADNPIHYSGISFFSPSMIEGIY